VGNSGRRLIDILVGFVVALYLAPLYWIAITSVKPTELINSKVPVWRFAPTTEHYVEAFNRFEFGNALLNSAIIVISSTLVTIALSLPAAYALSRMRLASGDRISIYILSLRFMPPVVVAMPYFLAYQNLGLIDTHLGMIIIYVGAGLPFAVWLLRGFMKDLPRDLEEAAHLDGLGPFLTLYRIVIPLMRPGIAVTAIFTFIFNWNEFLFALYITQSDSVTLPIQISKMIDQYSVLWGTVSAAVMMQLVPMIVVVFMLQRHMIRGLALGAVK
jgi:multiple sugar transport system permease protein